MNKQFATFNDNIRLTEAQEVDARTKYGGVCKTLHNHYYESTYNGASKFLFGSYKKKTNVRPIVPEQDVDVIFLMPKEEFERYDKHKGNGQSALLQKIRDILKNTYSTTETIKGWGKVVLVKFADNTHNVEVLPAWELKDGRFVIPNTEDGGSWEYFDPRKDIDVFQTSNKTTSGFTAELSRMIKTWKRNTASLSIKAFQLENYVINYLDMHYENSSNYSNRLKGFFKYLLSKVDADNQSYVQTAANRASKALEYEEKKRFDKACKEWRKIFGNQFPLWKRSIRLKAMDEDYTANEEYIEDMFSVNLAYSLKIDCTVEQDGFQKLPLSRLLEKFILKPQKKLEFTIVNTTAPKPYDVYWKVKNQGEEARNRHDLRGQIIKDDGYQKKKETTKYKGGHYVECFIVKDDICIARDIIFIPIERE